MCGIVGYNGSFRAKEVLINGLKSLEYRGYDSAGFAVLNDKNKLELLKEKGRVSNLESLDNFSKIDGNIGIAHTRWATHGKPSDTNSHPHLNQDKNIAVVHNGIIENYSDLRKFLESKNYKFYSETDTEVVPNLIDYYRKENNLFKDEYSFLEAVSMALKDIIGSYALEIISEDFKDIIFVAKKDSPLIIAKGNNENFIASDIPAVLNYSKDIYFLNDNEMAIVRKDNIEFFRTNLTPISKELTTIEWDNEAADKAGYEDYMLKEIFEEPIAIRKTIEGNKKIDEVLNFDQDTLSKINKIYIVACGTAMHAGLVGKNILEKLLRVDCIVDSASEFRYKNPIIDENTLSIFVSQSGETADTIAALKLAKERKSKTIAIANVIGSTITREADYTLYTKAGPEIAVASTKAYVSQICVLADLALYFAKIKNVDKSLISSIESDLVNIPTQIESLLNKDNVDYIKMIAKRFYKRHDIYFIGRQNDYNVSLEGSLKLKEISYIHSESYSAGELKHGPIALIENNVPVIGIITDDTLVEKTLSNIKEVVTRGAITVIITNKELPDKSFDYTIKIPETNNLLSPMLSIIPMQLFAYYITKEKGLDVDKPRNLAKSVTVE